MSSKPLRVAILWHQHQPYYKLENSYLLPWTRLHATKDYFDIAAALEEFPDVRQTINVVPSLLIQLLDYVENGASDRVLLLSQRPAAELDGDEKVAILRDFFLCNVDRMILPYRRYQELYRKAGSGERNDIERLRATAATFTTEDWLDLQVWYNLTWIGEYSRSEQPFAALLAKQQGFTEQEKQELLAASLRIVAKVIPTYRRLFESGQIELSVTPFYHPILPILCDSFSAVEAMPNVTLPEHHIRVPEDATVHIARAVEMFQQHFGKKPKGMWPSEGSVSDDATALIREAGLEWVATDEGVLRRSLGDRWNDLSKYFPYTLRTRTGQLWALFRDRELSDTIGFVYSSWKPQDAALDFYHRLIEIRSRIVQELGAGALDEAVVPVILDGENCWEYYERNGRPFLETLYKLLSESNELTTATFSEVVQGRRPHRDRILGRIFPGSWIGANFRIWIGHPEDNTAWDAVLDAREMLMQARPRLSDEVFAQAMEEIYIAEGSDWYWWFGDENSSANQDEFDELFRYHLRRVYTLIGEETPARLDAPIRSAAQGARVVPPGGQISPSIEGYRSSTDEWSNAGHFLVEHVGGAMHRADAFSRRIWFGCDDRFFYLRYDTTMPLDPAETIKLSVVARRTIILRYSTASVAIEIATEGGGRVSSAGIAAAIGDTIEAAIPLEHLAAGGSEPITIGIVCETFEHGHQTERFPLQGEVVLPLALEVVAVS